MPAKTLICKFVLQQANMQTDLLGNKFEILNQNIRCILTF